MAARKFAVHLLISLLVVLAVALPMAAPVQAATCNWEGDSGSAWETPGNWSCGTTPQSGDTVVINNVSPNPDPVLNSSTSVLRLDINGGGTVPRRGGILITTGGTTLTAGILNMNGQITGPGSVVVSNLWNWGLDYANMWDYDGTLSGGGNITLQVGGIGKIPVFGEEMTNLDNYTINNYGTLEPNSGTMRLGLENGAAIHNYGIFATGGVIYDNYTTPGYHSSFVNHSGGTLRANINVEGSRLDTVFANDGSVIIHKGDLTICRGGPHNGSFSALSNAYMYVGFCDDGDHPPAGGITFTSTSSITVPHVSFTGNYPLLPAINIYGTYGPIGTTSSTEIGTPTTFQDGAVITGFGNSLTTYHQLNILGIAPNDMTSLSIGGSLARFNYAGTIEAWTSLTCSGGATLTGGGTLIGRAGGTLTIGGSGGTACTLDGFNIYNNGTGTWSGVTDINSLNGSTIINNGTFNANAGDMMTGTLTFTNNGNLVKNGAGATTIDAAFTNNGAITINSGSLVFTQDFTLPAGSTNTITGTLEAANLINEGTLTVNGTVDGNLTNNNILFIKGTVTGNLVNNYSLDPGSSPGLVVVQGNFIQAANGGMGIDLSRDSGSPGVPPVAGVDYDKIQVAGTAQLDGHLQLIAGGTFNPHQPWLELPFLTAAGGITGEFSSSGSSDFDDFWNWSIIQRVNEMVFKFGGNVFIPLVTR